MKLIAALALAAGFALAERLPSDNPLIVHEWGTFTSVTGLDGRAAPWAPLHGPGDLPCFVERLGRGNLKFARGLVRMETPVLYFYPQSPLTLSVRVGFPRGWITEWYPKASSVLPSEANTLTPGGGSIEWNKVEVLPRSAAPSLPGTEGASHYYAARNTDAAPIRVGNQWEKLIFYRGMGNFQPPLLVTYQPDGRLQVTNTRSEAVPVAILFEHRNGKIAYSVARGIKDSVAFDSPKPSDALEPLLAELTGYLVEFGLYRKEAEAMVETWRDSWFEPGSRLFYIVPRGQVDELLPLQISPSPAALARVFVGRAELLSPWIRETIRAAAKEGPLEPVRQFGRFTGPFTYLMMQAGDRLQRTSLDAIFRTVNAPVCVQ